MRRDSLRLVVAPGVDPAIDAWRATATGHWCVVGRSTGSAVGPRATLAGTFCTRGEGRVARRSRSYWFLRGGRKVRALVRYPGLGPDTKRSLAQFSYGVVSVCCNVVRTRVRYAGYSACDNVLELQCPKERESVCCGTRWLY